MAMIKARVCVGVQISSAHVRDESFETMMDDSSFFSASSESGRRKLDSWAKTFFPSSEKVTVYSVSYA